MTLRINDQGRDKQNQFLSKNGENLNSLKSRHVQDRHLPEWLKDKVAAFWFCLVIKNMKVSGSSYYELTMQLPTSEESVCISKLSSSTHEIRLEIIRRWIDSVAQIETEAFTKNLVDAIYKNWKEIGNKNQATWLKKNPEQLEWAWKYINIRIPESHLTWFCPVNNEEKRIAILALLKILYPGDTPCQYKPKEFHVGICAEEHFYKRMHDAFRKQFIDGKKDKRVQINVKISPSAKSALDRLTRARKTTQQAILEQLILNGRLD
ncbi:hypothetical protein GP664_24425 [Escherichia coli]|uniref:hypothetical protein n=1 Tax=Escherichia coli TaxID=562 RepID=UPI0012FE6FEB|nr:hypothetical protein [Escherichia coli]MVW21584.1 hypothetical protein [Escherichia coli]